MVMRHTSVIDEGSGIVLTLNDLIFLTTQIYFLRDLNSLFFFLNVVAFDEPPQPSWQQQKKN